MPEGKVIHRRRACQIYLRGGSLLARLWRGGLETGGKAELVRSWGEDWGEIS